MSNQGAPNFEALSVRAYRDPPHNAVSLWFMNAGGPHVISLAWDQVGYLTDKLLELQASPPRRMQLQLTGPADYALPTCREYTNLLPPANGQEARIRLTVVPGTTLDIPLTRAALVALKADLEAHLQKYTG